MNLCGRWIDITFRRREFRIIWSWQLFYQGKVPIYWVELRPIIGLKWM